MAVVINEFEVVPQSAQTPQAQAPTQTNSNGAAQDKVGRGELERALRLQLARAARVRAH